MGRNAAADKTGAKTRDRKKRRELAHNLKLAKSCGMVVACTLMCYAPLGVMVSLLKDSQITIGLMLLNTWSSTLFLFASSLNTLLFFWRNGALRKEAVKALTLRK